uniref:Uncharacterized protein n=1 Tax=Plectus sambesii TaxID=2011161 RepID=A0A914W516_9BILA
MVARSSYYSSRGSNRLAWCMVFIFVILFLIFLTATIGLTALVLLDTHFTFGKTATDEDSSQWPEPSGSLLGTFQKAAIATDNGLCSEIGRDMLMKGGNAVDAMIAAMFCIGAIDPQSSGLGGGFFMTIYNSTTRKCVVIDAREVAPETASENMYEKDANASLVGM